MYNLKAKLQTETLMFDDLLLENGSVTKRIIDYEQKVNKLTSIVKS